MTTETRRRHATTLDRVAEVLRYLAGRAPPYLQGPTEEERSQALDVAIAMAERDLAWQRCNRGAAIHRRTFYSTYRRRQGDVQAALEGFVAGSQYAGPAIPQEETRRDLQ